MIKWLKLALHIQKHYYGFHDFIFCSFVLLNVHSLEVTSIAQLCDSDAYIIKII